MPSEPKPLAKGNPTEFTGTDAEFEWEAPTYNGGDKALEYEVQYCPQDSNGNYPKKDCKSVMTNTTSVSIPGLKAETSSLQIYLSYQQILTVFNCLRERFPFLCLEVLDVFQESMCISMCGEGIY